MNHDTPKNCGTCKHSVFRDSDREYMKCLFPVIPAAYVPGVIGSSDGCNFAGIHKTSGTNCPCYEQHDSTPNPYGNWCVMTRQRTVGRTVTESPAEIVESFDSERAALMHRDKLRTIEPTKWNDTGKPFAVYYVVQQGWKWPA